MTTRFPQPLQYSGRYPTSARQVTSTPPPSTGSTASLTVPGATTTRAYSNRLSRRSFSRNPGNGYAASKSPGLDALKRILKPEWEVDYLNELNDNKEVSIEQAQEDEVMESVDETLSSLQELRYLSSLDESLLKVPIEENLAKLTEYQKILTDSRIFLKPLFDYLLNFENDLNKLSLEMEFLQKRSHNLNYQIDDKSKIETKLTPIINDLIIPPEIIKSIVVGPIEENWIENLRFITEKREIYSKYNDLYCMPDLIKLLDFMEFKAIERIRDFIIIQIKTIRKANVSSQVCQKKLLDVKEAFNFLNDKHPKLASELRVAYCYTMRWYYYQNFVKYLSSLEKLNLVKVGHNIMLGSNEDESAVAKSFFGGVSSTKHKKTTGDNELTLNEYLIGLTKRLEILTNSDEIVMPAQIAEHNKLKYPLEYHFRNFNQSLLDNISTEYLFLSEFFKVNSFEMMNELSKLIFNPCYQLGHNYTKHLMIDTYDIFGILIIIRLCQSMEYELQRRRVPIMEDYLNYQLILLWPKFQSLVDENCNSIKKTVSSTAILKQISKNVMIPLNLTQNFGIVLLNLLKLSTNLVFELETSEPLTNSITRMSVEFENAVMKLGGSNKKKELFYYNNFYLVWSILSSSDEFKDGVGKWQVDHFKHLVDAYGH